MEFTERPSGLAIPVSPPDRVPEGDSPEYRPTVADWERFRGCNHERIDNCGLKFGGGMRFGNHVGKPLSQSLWTDLVHRFGVWSLWVLTEDEEQWTLGRMAYSATVYVSDHSETGVVTDIWLGFN